MEIYPHPGNRGKIPTEFAHFLVLVNRKVIMKRRISSLPQNQRGFIDLFQGLLNLNIQITYVFKLYTIYLTHWSAFHQSAHPETLGGSAGGRLMLRREGPAWCLVHRAGLESGSTRLDLMDLEPGSRWVDLEPGPSGGSQALGPLR